MRADLSARSGIFRDSPGDMRILDLNLPDRFDGWSVRYPTNVRPSAADARAGLLGSEHGVELYTLSAWCDRFLGRQFTADITTHDWLSSSRAIVLTVTAGAVFRDDIGELSALRDRLCYFTRDVWLYKLAAQWNRRGARLCRSNQECR
ncbi:MAG: DUF4037 domain-containing protein [Mesorhizobium sp.]|nr:MAG: DUF4037 domain-containing protein [Mesorhizobium sp.]